MVKNNLNLVKSHNLQIQEIQWALRKKKYKETTLRYILVKLLKTRTVQYTKDHLFYINMQYDIYKYHVYRSYTSIKISQGK